ncbi:MAG: Ppx/GppA family phosphatase [Proteobacteria bacterium]|nr:Ppx/GppA family phosphatase [Pseudomonadota bacterium]
MSDQRLDTKNYVAIIDIGSNAVRLVVYDGLNRAPFKIHSERVVCNLGADLAMTGRLNPDSVKKAFDAISRFSGLLTAMKIKNVRAVATAAMRDAKDGRDFIDRVQEEFGLEIRVIDGDEEARLAAQGVIANGLGGNGVIGDYGGGSLELIVVENHKVKHKASLPLGSHRLLAEAGRSARIKKIDAHLTDVDFLKDYSGADFYAMGGAWRSMAMAHIYMTKHPLKLLDHYQIDGRKASEFAALISRQSMASLEKIVGLSKKRVKDMGVAALAMECLFEKIRPRQLIFSGTGLREGLLFDQLKPATQRQDALIASCTKIALKISRFDDLRGFKDLFTWTQPLFEKKDAGFKRLLEASCLLSDTSWFESEDYQADHAFERILVMPFYGIDHADRAFLAVSQFVRYRGYLRRGSRAQEPTEVTRPAQKLLDGDWVDLAMIAGLAQRIGYLLTGGALGLLQHTELRATPKQLYLKLNDKASALNAEVIREALQALAKLMGKEAVVEG